VSDPGATFRSLNRIESGVLADHLSSKLPVQNKAADGITIFTPSWNHRLYLPRALRSALSALDHLAKTGFDAEILVVDDASRDGSQKLLRSVRVLYDEPRLKVLFLNRNLGLPRLRNLGLRESRFRYVCWLDADNELIPENLPLFLQSIVDTGATVVHGNLIAKREGRIFNLKSNTAANMHLSADNQIDAFALFDTERLLRLGGYHPWFYSGSDWEMILHLISEEEKIVFVPAVLGYYYLNRGSMFWEAKQNRENLKFLTRRMYAQTGTREWDPEKVGLTYHPEVGYID
jgi:glycosyltransferase involved in cell wall biosynthesis